MAKDIKQIGALRANNLRSLLISMNEQGLTKDNVISMFTVGSGSDEEIVAVYYD